MGCKISRKSVALPSSCCCLLLLYFLFSFRQKCESAYTGAYTLQPHLTDTSVFDAQRFTLAANIHTTYPGTRVVTLTLTRPLVRLLLPDRTMSCFSAAVVLVVLLVATTTAQEQRSGQKCYDLQTQTLGRSGIKFGGSTYGVLLDSAKQPIVQLLDKTRLAFQKPLSSDQLASRASGRFSKDAKLADVYSNSPDFPSFHEVGQLANANPCLTEWQQSAACIVA